MAGFSAVSAKSAALARTELAKSQEFDLILSDISMPNENGFEFLQWLRSQGGILAEIPVLLMTAALPENEHRVRGLALGAMDYIIRPISNEELLLRVTHAIENQLRFRNLQRSLADSAQIASMGRLLAANHHEVKNLVSLISITTEQVQRCFATIDDRNRQAGMRALNALGNASEMLLTITRKLNTFGNIEISAPIPCDAVRLIDEIVQLVRYRALPTQIIAPNPGTHSQMILADPMAVKQILINFALNAIESLQEAGKNAEGRIQFKVTEGENNHLQIRVEDNGLGLPQTNQTEFASFVTTKSLKGGSGLGLWWSSQLAISMNGNIVLQSPGPGLGATALLILPRSQ